MIKRNCILCGKKFETYKCRIKIGRSRFCSGSCSTKYTRNGLRTCFKKGQAPWNKGMKNWMSKEGKRAMIKKLKGKTPWIAGKKHSTTTRKKMSKPRKKRENFIRGEKNHNWKGGITPINKKLRNSRCFRVWREAIFVRDNWTCRLCGDNGHKGRGKTVILNPHHMVPFASILNEIKYAYSDGKITFERALRYSFLWDIKNGITICKKCHLKCHKNKF